METKGIEMKKQILVALLSLAAGCSYAGTEEKRVTSISNEAYTIDGSFGQLILTKDCSFSAFGSLSHIDKSQMTITFQTNNKTCQIVGFYKENSFSSSPFFDRVDHWKSSSDFYVLEGGRIVRTSGCWGNSGDVFVGSDGIAFSGSRTLCSIREIYEPN